MNTQIEKYAQKVLAGGDLDKNELLELVSLGEKGSWDLIYYANLIREKKFGKKIKVCSIVPGRLGGCSEDCKFCAQSARYQTHIGKAKYTSEEDILAAAKEAKENGVPTLGIVNSGQSVSEDELERLVSLIEKIHAEYGLKVCASLGILNKEQAGKLAQAGVARYNHNLETSERNFGEIVGTHTFQDRVDTIENCLEAGMGVCAGGIFGIGESDQDRIDMVIKLRELGVDMVPMNFLHPMEGTPLADIIPLSPMEILTLVAIYRFAIPKAEIKVAGGRLLNLRDVQSWMFHAGATALMSGNYLTTAGRSVKEDMQMVRDLGLEPILMDGC